MCSVLTPLQNGSDKSLHLAVDVCWLASENDTPPAQVAVKRLRYEALRHKRDLERFFHEAATLRKIQHKWAL